MSDDWRNGAECLNLPEARKDIFFSLVRPDMKAAKAMCAKCPVRRECLEDSLEQQDRFGIFGGADQYQRRQALQIDREGHASANAKPIRCPLCGEKKINTNIKRRSWMRVTCSAVDCQLSWVAKRVVPRKKTEPTEAGTNDSQAVERTL
jgi:WhiB family redox-sensing transcriptional regulator